MMKDYKDIIKEQEDKILTLNVQLKRVESELESYRKDIDSKEKHILQLQHELDEIISLKKHVKKFIRKRLLNVDGVVERRLSTAREFQPSKPKLSGDLLSAARLSDRENLEAYNNTYKESKGVRIYRRAKRMAQRPKGKSDNIA